MYARNSPARQIADDVMQAGAMAGHISLDGGCKSHILHFLAEFQECSTLEGWINSVRVHGHEQSQFTMAFILAHSYLRCLFPQDVLDEMWPLAARSALGAAIVRVALDGRIPLEHAHLFPDLTEEEARQFNSSGHWADLPGLQEV